jgi:hypothetical protein
MCYEHRESCRTVGFLWMAIAGRCASSSLTGRACFVLLAGIAATGFGLLQPYISKLLIDDALAKRNMRMLLMP